VEKCRIYGKNTEWSCSTDNKTLLNAATTSPPLSFSKSLIAFSKPKQDVWGRLVLTMDGQQEPVRYKSNLLFG